MVILLTCFILDWLFYCPFQLSDKVSAIAKSKGSQLGLITQMESAISLLNLRAICERGRAEDKAFKFEALVFGSDDFLVSIGRVNSSGSYYHLQTY